MGKALEGSKLHGQTLRWSAPHAMSGTPHSQARSTLGNPSEAGTRPLAMPYAAATARAGRKAGHPRSPPWAGAVRGMGGSGRIRPPVTVFGVARAEPLGAPAF